jgi:hypothetical protein
MPPYWEIDADSYDKSQEETPINERRSISSHTPTEHGVYDDEPFPTEGLAYYWYQRAVYWKREAHRSEGTQQTMNFEEKHVSGMSVNDVKIVRDAIKAQLHINAIKHVRTVTNLGLKEAKDICDQMRSDMGWNGQYGLDCKFSKP